jgi:hypothetical protein
MTTTYLFLRLSKVRIFLSAANHTKNAALEGDLVLHTLFQGKLLPSILDKALKKPFTLKVPFLEGIHHILSWLAL